MGLMFHERRALGLIGLIGPIGPIRSSTTPSECALRLDATLSEKSCPRRPDVSEFLAVFALAVRVFEAQ
jgi:hypothetical protein